MQINILCYLHSKVSETFLIGGNLLWYMTWDDTLWLFNMKINADIYVCANLTIIY